MIITPGRAAELLQGLTPEAPLWLAKITQDFSDMDDDGVDASRWQYNGPTMFIHICALRRALAEARISHFALRDDEWYSCPKSPDGCANGGAGTDCTCGADEHNVRIDRMLSDKEPPTLPVESGSVTVTKEERDALVARIADLEALTAKLSEQRYKAERELREYLEQECVGAGLSTDTEGSLNPNVALAARFHLYVQELLERAKNVPAKL